MNEILRIMSSALPDARLSQLPIRCDFDNPERNNPPEFWLAVSTDKQQILLENLKDSRWNISYMRFPIRPLKSQSLFVVGFHIRIQNQKS